MSMNHIPGCISLSDRGQTVANVAGVISVIAGLALAILAQMAAHYFHTNSVYFFAPGVALAGVALLTLVLVNCCKKEKEEPPKMEASIQRKKSSLAMGEAEGSSQPPPRLEANHRASSAPSPASSDDPHLGSEDGRTPSSASLEKQPETAQGSERIRLRATRAATTVHGKRFDPNKHRIACICATGEDASQVAYAVFRYAYPKMELLSPHGMHTGFNPGQVFYEARCTPPKPDFFKAIGMEPVPKFGEKELGTAPCVAFDTDSGQQKMKEAMGVFYSPHKSKTTLYLVFGSAALHTTVAKKIGRSDKCILCPQFNPTGTYEEIANQIIDAIENGLFWSGQH